jgi:hypothetical protein
MIGRRNLVDHNLTLHGTSFHAINVVKTISLTKMSAYEVLLKNATDKKNLSFGKNGWALGIF